MPRANRVQNRLRSEDPLRPERPRRFVALDFETADYFRDSACQIALVRVEGARIVDQVARLIRPPRREFKFTGIHGITWKMVAREPSFGELWPEIAPWFRGVEFVAAHNAPFDRSVLRACCAAAEIEPPDVEFRDTVRLSKEAWGLPSATLPIVCQMLRIPLNHHDAESDAIACAKIVLAAERA